MPDADPLPGLTRVQQHLDELCREHGHQRADLRLIAVTKTQDPLVLGALAQAGVHDYGENRHDHLAQMAEGAPLNAQFHYIGRVQRRQFSHILPHSRIIHSLAQPHHLPALAKAARDLGCQVAIFFQIHNGLEQQKAGIDPTELGQVLDQASAYDEVIQVLGLMTMAPDLSLGTHSSDDIRRCFANLRILAEQHGLKRLSMGMSGDYPYAVSEGATDLRIGGALFAGAQLAHTP